uniref:Putative ABC transporter n=1 Tax=uncultured Aquificaceae bacterium TaxID=374108 RepID=A0A146JAW2_9AQUI|nr:putative ABC transporter [uncultured Aquificaceae bacterium]
MYHVLFLSLKLLFERKRQTLVSIAGVSIGVAAFIVMSSLMNGFQKYFIEQAIDLNAHITLKVKPENNPDEIIKLFFGRDTIAKVYGYKPKEKKDKITQYKEIIQTYSKNPDIIGVAPHLVSQAIIRYGTVEKAGNLIGIDPTLERKASVIDKFIVNKKLDTLLSDRNSIIVGKLLAKDLGIDELGKKVILTTPNGNQQIFKVVDFFDSGITNLDQTRIYINLRTAQSILERPNEVNEIIFKIKDVNKAERLSKQIQNQTGYYTESWQYAYKNFLKLFKIQNYITYMIVFAILVVSAFGIFNIIMMTVMEKKKDIAILKAVGYEESDIVKIFVYQGFIIGFLGYIIGSILGYAIQEWLSSIKIDVEGLVRSKGFILDRSVIYYIYGFLFSITFSVLASFYPSYKASKLNPVDIFRSG